MFGIHDVRPLLTRRRLLVAGLGAGVVVSGFGTVGWGVLGHRDPAHGLPTLADSEAVVVEAVADAYFPVGNPFGVAARDIDVRGPVDAYVTLLYATERRGMRALLRGLERWPQLSGHGGAFSTLDVASRVAVLQAFDASTITERRLLGTVLRTICLMPLFEDEGLLAAIGFRHGCALPVTADDDVGIG